MGVPGTVERMRTSAGAAVAFTPLAPTLPVFKLGRARSAGGWGRSCEFAGHEPSSGVVRYRPPVTSRGGVNQGVRVKVGVLSARLF